MFSSTPSDKKPSLLTLANRAADASKSHKNVVNLNGGTDQTNNGSQSSAVERTHSANTVWNALRGHKKATPESADDGDAIASIERDVDALVGERIPNHYTSSYYGDDAFKPLIDPIIVLNAIWRWRWPIVATTLVGGVAGVLFALGTPHVYTAYSQVLIDPRQVKLVERDLTPEFLGNESALAIVDSQLESVYTTPVLLSVIEKLSLNQDAEFNGSSDSGIGLFDGIAFVRSLFSDETPIDTNDRLTVENLREAISAERTSRTFVFSISAESQSPRRAAQIANAVTESFIENQRDRESLAARTASTALGGQLVKLKAAVENAEREAEAFAQANSLTRVEGLTLTDNQLVATSSQLSEAKAATIRAKSFAEAAQSANVDSVVNGALPPELVNSALITFRAQFSSLSQNAAALEQALGPRHPRLATAIAARESARGEIAAELQRIIAGTQADLRRAIGHEQQIAASLAQTRAEQGQSGEALITLRELESEIEAAQAIYKAALLRSRETNQLEALVSVNATIISEAEPPLTASSLSRKFIAGSGALAGLLLGLGLAFFAGLRDCVQANKNAPARWPTRPGGNSPTNRRQNVGSSLAAQSNPINATPTALSGHTANSETEMYPRAPYYPYAQTEQQHETQPQHGYAPQGLVHPQQMMHPHMQPAHMPYHPAQMPPQMYGQPHPHMYPAQAPVPQEQFPSNPMQHYGTPDYGVPAGVSQEEMEMEELRASVRELRDVVDHLTQSRSTRQRFG